MRYANPYDIDSLRAGFTPVRSARSATLGPTLIVHLHAAAKRNYFLTLAIVRHDVTLSTHCD